MWYASMQTTAYMLCVYVGICTQTLVSMHVLACRLSVCGSVCMRPHTSHTAHVHVCVCVCV